jgi:hypothetical protein
MKTRLAVAAIGLSALVVAPLSAFAAAQPGVSQPAPTAVQQTVNWQIPLAASKGFARVTGSAQYQAQPGQRELQVELEHLRSLAGRTLRVRVSDVTVGSMRVSRTGIAQLTLNTERGQRVPAVQHGSTLAVKSSVVIASGTF